MAALIFISYSHVNRAVAEQIASALSARGLSPWIDIQEVKPGASFIEGMNRGLTDASYVLLLLSSASARSEMVQREWMSALASRSVAVIPVLLDATTVPILLRDIVYFDLRQDTQNGIDDIVRFFERETEAMPAPAFRTASFLRTASRRQLRLVAVRCLDEEGLSAFCFDCDINANSLYGNSVNEKILSLLHRMANDALINAFAEWLDTERGRCVSSTVTALKDSPSWAWSSEIR